MSLRTDQQVKELCAKVSSLEQTVFCLQNRIAALERHTPPPPLLDKRTKEYQQWKKSIS